MNKLKDDRARASWLQTKGLQKKIRKAGYEVGGYLVAICDKCGKDCFKEDFYSLKKWKRFPGFGRGDDEQLECICKDCFLNPTHSMDNSSLNY